MGTQPEADYDAQDEVLRVSGPGFYLLVQMPLMELLLLEGIQAFSWEDRGSIKAGEAFGKPVHWCRSSVDPGAVSILVGADDETWELALELPADVLLRAVPGS